MKICLPEKKRVRVYSNTPLHAKHFRTLGSGKHDWICYLLFCNRAPPMDWLCFFVYFLHSPPCLRCILILSRHLARAQDLLTCCRFFSWGLRTSTAWWVRYVPLETEYWRHIHIPFHFVPLSFRAHTRVEQKAHKKGRPSEGKAINH